MINPNKYIRTGYVSAFAGIGAPVWSKKVPKDKSTPDVYVIIGSQTKNITSLDKDGFEWFCTITIDITSIRPSGYSDQDILDDMEEKINDIVQAEIDVPGFIVKSTTLEDSRDLELETSTQTIERRILTYSHWLNNIDE